LSKKKRNTKGEENLAIHKSAIKRHRQSLIRKAKNKAVKTRMKTAVKSLLQTIESKETAAIPEKLKQATSIIAKTESKGILKKNTAARKISRLTKRANIAAQA
jgi:small subunit ribosomal protein S20